MFERFKVHLLGLLLMTVAWPTHAQTPLTEAQIKAKYRHCPAGFYSGPQPGKTRYTKDEYLWVVSPEFAEQYCMPAEFVDKELKGADAVAFRVTEAGTEECGYGGKREVCSRRKALGFEIYYKSSLKLPAINDTKYAARALYMYPLSTHLVSLSPDLPWDIRNKGPGTQWERERPGYQPKFRPSSFGMVGVKGSRVPWPIVAFREVMYIEDLLPGYVFISLEGSIGRFDNARMQKLGIKKFSIVLNHPDDRRSDEDLEYPKDYAHVIELPEWYVERVRAVDRVGGKEWQALVQRALPEMFAKTVPK